MGETTARILYSGFVLWFRERNKVFLEKGYNVTAIDKFIKPENADVIYDGYTYVEEQRKELFMAI